MKRKPNDRFPHGIHKAFSAEAFDTKLSAFPYNYLILAPVAKASFC